MSFGKKSQTTLRSTILAVVLAGGGLLLWVLSDREKAEARGDAGKDRDAGGSPASQIDDSARTSGKTESAEARSKALREVWDLAKNSPDIGAVLRTINDRWGALGGKEGEKVAKYVLSRAYREGKLADPHLIEGLEVEDLQIVAGSQIAKAIGDKHMGQGVDFIISLPTAKLRDRVTMQALAFWTSFTDAPGGGNSAAVFANWLQTETDPAVRQTIWTEVYSRKPPNWGEAETEAWEQLGLSLDVVTQ
jgi:hypothetical protein